jgi:predicted nuclease with RNAse H fold
MADNVLFGIDFGSKLTGNTVIAIFQNPRIIFMDVDKGVDADQFILNAADHFKPSHVFIDAPLSLPGVYKNIDGCSNYHFRHADLDLKAMSPMFLGGLAARAMQVKDQLEQKGALVFETYPRILANRFDLPSRGYKGSNQGLKCCRSQIAERFNGNIELSACDITTWHHLDALMALMSAMNFDQGCADSFGREDEGLIFI